MLCIIVNKSKYYDKTVEWNFGSVANLLEQNVF